MLNRHEPMTLETKRLTLRQWTTPDIAAFNTMSANPEVMRYFPAILTQEQSTQLALSLQGDIAKQGWGLWAVALKETGEFIGFTGLRHQTGDIPLSPFIEIAWRLDERFWHQGYASEAAKAALSFAFRELDAPTVLAFTTCTNAPSIALMQRIGMRKLNQDFKHPLLDRNHPLADHVLYIIDREEWQPSGDI
ncbi:GNAT family N-acetyltransferase [Zymobacter palmae]|uniref:Acetyltransferases, including N-acetylases n=1 Tax=Zymobacter palmae TaxID=33074 RepID=A0A348HB35_9GAMM|nr:GNAT family N-acetyltransferase [Zymobacter palmae]BBG28837.1 acetyltransferases, including N-acetylases [Zymobacter palmae]